MNNNKNLRPDCDQILKEKHKWALSLNDLIDSGYLGNNIDFQQILDYKLDIESTLDYFYYYFIQQKYELYKKVLEMETEINTNEREEMVDEIDTGFLPKLVQLLATLKTEDERNTTESSAKITSDGKHFVHKISHECILCERCSRCVICFYPCDIERDLEEEQRDKTYEIAPNLPVSSVTTHKEYEKELEKNKVEMSALISKLTVSSDTTHKESENELKKKENKFNVIVQLADSRTTTISCNANDTVFTLKRKIQEKEGISVDEQSLVFGTKVLQDNKDLIQHNFYNNCFVYSFPRFIGGN
jgi:DNA polymerase III gamma/tau subunit